MTDYWRARRAHEREQKIMNGLLKFLTKLLKNVGNQSDLHNAPSVKVKLEKL